MFWINHPFTQNSFNCLSAPFLKLQVICEIMWARVAQISAIFQWTTDEDTILEVRDEIPVLLLELQQDFQYAAVLLDGLLCA
jgi:hypothetical protein